MKRRPKKKPESKNISPGMSIIVRTVTRLTVGVFLLYAFHIVAQGHRIPGGGFAGGGIAGLSFLNVLVAFGSEAALKKLNRVRAVSAAGIGMLLILVIGVAGKGKGAYFADFFPGGFSGCGVCGGGSIFLYNIGIFILVGAGLCAVFISFIAPRNGEDRE